LDEGGENEKGKRENPGHVFPEYVELAVDPMITTLQP
jgi:hypothetical protein